MSTVSDVTRAVAVFATTLCLLTAPSACDVYRAPESAWPRLGDRDRGAPNGIIVLGGGLASYMEAEQERVPADGPGERLAAGIHLAKRFPKAILLYTGVETPPGSLAPLLRAGIPRAQILIESKARTTAENAKYSAALAQPRPGDRWLLVTSAYHMPRALKCFRVAGFDVEPYPVDFRPPSGSNDSLAWHEYIGAIAYRVLGRCRAGRDDP